MDIISNRDENEYEDMTMGCELPTADPYNTKDTSKNATVIDRDEKMDATANFLNNTMAPILIKNILTSP